MVYTYLWSTIGDGILLFHSHWWSKQLHSSSSVFVMFILCVWSTMEVSIQIWVNYNNSLTWIVRPFEDDFPKINHDSQWGRSEVAIIYPDTWNLDLTNICIYIYIDQFEHFNDCVAFFQQNERCRSKHCFQLNFRTWGMILKHHFRANHSSFRDMDGTWTEWERVDTLYPFVTLHPSSIFIFPKQKMTYSKLWGKTITWNLETISNFGVKPSSNHHLWRRKHRENSTPFP